jgi:hypothetical protein
MYVFPAAILDLNLLSMSDLQETIVAYDDDVNTTLYYYRPLDMLVSASNRKYTSRLPIHPAYTSLYVSVFG